MHRNIFVEDIERDANGQPISATGIAEMAGIEARWTGQRPTEHGDWQARIDDGQLTGVDIALIDLFTCSPPLGRSVGMEIRRLMGAS